MHVEGRVKPGYYPEFPVDRILEPKFSFRMNVDEGIDDLMYQIFAAGMVIEPIICRPAPGRPGYVEVGPGERRLRAAKRLHMMTIPVIVREMDDDEFDRIRMLEKLARKDLSDIEIARILKHMPKNYPKEYPSQQVLANALGKTRQWVFYHFKMLELEDLLTRVNNKSSFEAEAEGGESEEVIVNAGAETRGDADGEAEEKAEVRVCPVCGRPLEEEEYERLRRKFSRFSGLFD